eukprot:TRINITY_DN14451_c0_g1_i2.p1 TRINITY_DN14451_c0_g1~~TRINITY_DN14451_c0_g1_i2.p1  ORF type:complete len:194 (-),score=37.25 TRINITY_DN14451_c0_g1_i2:11-511(-)
MKIPILVDQTAKKQLCRVAECNIIAHPDLVGYCIKHATLAQESLEKAKQEAEAKQKLEKEVAEEKRKQEQEWKAANGVCSFCQSPIQSKDQAFCVKCGKKTIHSPPKVVLEEKDKKSKDLDNGDLVFLDEKEIAKTPTVVQPPPKPQIGRAVQQECRDRSRMPSSA